MLKLKFALTFVLPLVGRWHRLVQTTKSASNQEPLLVVVRCAKQRGLFPILVLYPSSCPIRVFFSLLELLFQSALCFSILFQRQQFFGMCLFPFTLIYGCNHCPMDIYCQSTLYNLAQMLACLMHKKRNSPSNIL